MMDDLLPSITGDFPQDCLTILLLPGSRFPESLHNWQQILAAVTAMIGRFPITSWNFWQRSLLLSP